MGGYVVSVGRKISGGLDEEMKEEREEGREERREGRTNKRG